MVQAGQGPLAAAGAVCGWIDNRIDTTTGTLHPEVTVYAYRAGANDAVITEAEHTTTVLAQYREKQQRWFRIEIAEFDPDRMPPWQIDHDVLTALHDRATGTPRPFTI